MLFLSTRRLLISIPIFLLVAAGLFIGLRPGLRNAWVANRYAARAEALTLTGGHEAARLSATKALGFDRNCVRAYRALLAEVPQSDFNDIIFIRSRLADLVPGDHGNLRMLVLFGIYSGRFDLSARAIKDLESGKFDGSQVLELEARLSAAQGDFPESEKQAQLLLQKDPANPAGRLILALAQIHEGKSSEWPKAEKELEELLTVRALRLEAERGLRHLALLRKDIPRAEKYSNGVVADPMARFDDWLNHAEILYQRSPERLPELLAELTTHTESDPKGLPLIAAWLRKNGQTDRIVPWMDSCKALQTNPIIAQSIRAETLMDQKAWPQLSAYLEHLRWTPNDYFRLTLLARAHREQNLGFLKAWKSATEEALKRPESARQLAEIISSWPDWQAEKEAFLWDAGQKDPRNLRWALAGLSEIYQKEKNTKGLLRVAEEYYRTYPSSEPIQNNLAFYSLLENTFLDRAFRISDALYLAHPNAPEIVSTYTLALLRRHEPQKALAALSKLPPEILSRHDIAPYYAAVLAANGLFADARKVKNQINQDDLLPEERDLLKFN